MNNRYCSINSSFVNSISFWPLLIPFSMTHYTTYATFNLMIRQQWTETKIMKPTPVADPLTSPSFPEWSAYKTQKPQVAKGAIKWQSLSLHMNPNVNVISFTIVSNLTSHHPFHSRVMYESFTMNLLSKNAPIELPNGLASWMTKSASQNCTILCSTYFFVTKLLVLLESPWILN